MSSQELPDLLILVRRHLRLLKDYSQKAFIQHDDDYLGEVAAKLRLLVSTEGSNVPLLLRLLDEFEIDEKITLSEPGSPRILSLREFVKLDAFAQRLPSGELVGFTKIEIIRTFAEKLGAAHVDWTVPDKFQRALDNKISLGGLHPIAREIRSVANAVTHIGEHFLSKLTTEMIREKTLQRIRRRSCQQPDEFNQKGVLLTQFGKLREAIVCFRKATEGLPSELVYRMNLGLGLMRIGTLDEARDIFEAILTDFPDNTQAIALYGVTLSKQQEYAEAAAQFSRIIEIKPTDESAFHDRGVCYLEAQDLQKAASDFESAIALNPAAASSYYSLAAVRSLQGMLAESVALLKRVKSLERGKQFAPIGDADFKAVEDDAVFGPQIRGMFTESDGTT